MPVCSHIIRPPQYIDMNSINHVLSLEWSINIGHAKLIWFGVSVEIFIPRAHAQQGSSDCSWQGFASWLSVAKCKHGGPPPPPKKGNFKLKNKVPIKRSIQTRPKCTSTCRMMHLKIGSGFSILHLQTDFFIFQNTHFQKSIPTVEGFSSNEMASSIAELFVESSWPSQILQVLIVQLKTTPPR